MAELVKGEVLTAAEDAVIDHQATPLTRHIADFFDHQNAKGVTARQIADSRSRLNRVVEECGFGRFADLSAPILEKWLSTRQASGMGAVTRNAYREACITFANWCVRNRRLLSNPFVGVPKADAKADLRRKRRALTEDELRRLLDVARRRPLLDAMTVYKGKRKGEAYAKLRPEVQRRLERLGQERALIYKTLVLTGLRKGELASLTVGQVVLDGPMPYLILEAADEKNRQGSTIPLRADLAADLRGWLADKATTLQEAPRATPTVRFDSKHQKRDKRNQSDSTGAAGAYCLPLTRLPADTPLFTVPAGLVRILDRDLVAAGIARRVEVDGKWKIDKRDERGRTVDVHALRHTFGTLFSAGGVAPRTAQAAMRHSTIDLTMNVYTDPKLLDVAGAMESLPALPLSVQGGQDGIAVASLRATGTENAAAEMSNARSLPSVVTPRAKTNSVPSPLAPTLAPTTGKTCILQSVVGKIASETEKSTAATAAAASSCLVKQNNPLTTAVNGLRKVEPTGIEPATSWMQTRRSPN